MGKTLQRVEMKTARKTENVSAAEINKRVTPSCSRCGSSDIRVEAFAEWNERVQGWRVKELLDGNQVCNGCGQDCDIRWRVI